MTSKEIRIVYNEYESLDQLDPRDRELAQAAIEATKSSYEGIETILTSIEKAKLRLKANVNFDLLMELLLLTIKEN